MKSELNFVEDGSHNWFVSVTVYSYAACRFLFRLFEGGQYEVIRQLIFFLLVVNSPGY